MQRHRTRLPRATTRLYQAQKADTSDVPAVQPTALPTPASAEIVQKITEALNDLIAIDSHGLLQIGSSVNIPPDATFKCVRLHFTYNFLKLCHPIIRPYRTPSSPLPHPLCPAACDALIKLVIDAELK